MADSSRITELTGNAEFDSLIAAMAAAHDASQADAVRDRIWERFGTEGAVFISDMAGFSSTSRKMGVCHFLKMIHRARSTIASEIAANRGTLLKCDADNCYALFETADDAIEASMAVNAAVFALNDSVGLVEQIYLSVGIDYGRLLLVGDNEYFGDPVNTASKLGEDLAMRAETLVTERALATSTFVVPEAAERMVARISDIEINYVRIPMTKRQMDRQ
jgi:adenylate cyclase